MSANTIELIVFFVYFVAMLVIGVYFFIKSKDAGGKKYFLAEREMGPWVTALSAGASDMSAWVLMGLPASIYALGTSQAWIAVGLFFGYSYPPRKKQLSFCGKKPRGAKLLSAERF